MYKNIRAKHTSIGARGSCLLTSIIIVVRTGSGHNNYLPRRTTKRVVNGRVHVRRPSVNKSLARYALVRQSVRRVPWFHGRPETATTTVRRSALETGPRDDDYLFRENVGFTYFISSVYSSIIIGAYRDSFSRSSRLYRIPSDDLMTSFHTSNRFRGRFRAIIEYFWAVQC